MPSFSRTFQKNEGYLQEVCKFLPNGRNPTGFIGSKKGASPEGNAPFETIESAYFFLAQQVPPGLLHLSAGFWVQQAPKVKLTATAMIVRMCFIGILLVLFLPRPSVGVL
jgi:hypothetical protein